MRGARSTTSSAPTKRSTWRPLRNATSRAQGVFPNCLRRLNTAPARRFVGCNTAGGSATKVAPGGSAKHSTLSPLCSGRANAMECSMCSSAPNASGGLICGQRMKQLTGWSIFKTMNRRNCEESDFPILTVWLSPPMGGDRASTTFSKSVTHVPAHPLPMSPVYSRERGRGEGESLQTSGKRSIAKGNPPDYFWQPI